MAESYEADLQQSRVSELVCCMLALSEEISFNAVVVEDSLGLLWPSTLSIVEADEEDMVRGLTLRVYRFVLKQKNPVGISGSSKSRNA
jgi:hypothetical protein